MLDPQQSTPPDTLPANFFQTQSGPSPPPAAPSQSSTAAPPPDTLPADFFQKQPTQADTSGFDTSSLGPNFKPDYSVDVYAKPLPPDAEPGFWGALWNHIKDSAMGSAMAPFDVAIPGVYRGAAGASHLFGNAMDALDHIEKLSENITGQKGTDWYKRAADWFHSQAAGAQQTAQNFSLGRKQDFGTQLGQAMVSGATQIPQLALATAAAAPMAAVTGLGELGASMAGFGGLSALGQEDKGVGPALTAGAEGAISGGAYHFLSPLGLPLRVPLNALFGYLSSDGDATAKLSSGAAQGLFSMLPGAGGAGVRDIAQANLDMLPRVRNQLNPLELKNQQWLAEQGISTPLSMQTGSRTAANLEGSVRQSLGGGYAETARQQTRADVLARAQAELEKIHPEPETLESAGAAVSQKLSADLENTRTNLANEVSPNPTTPEQAGQKVIDAGKSRIQLLDKQADQGYKAAWQAERDPRNIEAVPVRDEDGGLVHDSDGNVTTQKMPLPIDMTDVQHALQPIADRYAYTLSETDARASLGLKAMRQIINGPAMKPASAAELDLGMLKDAARNENLPELRDTSQGLAAQSVKQLQMAIDAKMAGAAYPGWDPESGTPSPALDNLRAGRRATAQKYDVADTFAGLGRRNIDELEPVGVHQRLTSAGDAGINQLRAIAKVAPDAMPDVGRAFIEGGGNWSKLGPETKKIIFGGDDNLISNLDALYAKERKFSKLTQMEPVPLFDKLTAARGRMVSLLRSVAEETPQQIPQIARAWTQGLLDTITQKGDIHHADSVWNSWFKMDPQTKKILFPNPGQVDDLNNVFFALQRLNREVNPSGSGYIVAINAMKRDVLRGLGMVAGGATGLAEGGAGGATVGAGLGFIGSAGLEAVSNATLARLLYDPRFTRMLTQGIQLQLRGDPRAALAAKSLAQMVYAARLPGETPEPPK